MINLKDIEPNNQEKSIGISGIRLATFLFGIETECPNLPPNVIKFGKPLLKNKELILKIESLDGEGLYRLLTGLDAYRKKQRFFDYLTVIHAVCGVDAYLTLMGAWNMTRKITYPEKRREELVRVMELCELEKKINPY